jgi:hypothetical protein
VFAAVVVADVVEVKEEEVSVAVAAGLSWLLWC